MSETTTKIRNSITVLSGSDFSPDLVKDMCELVKIAYSIKAEFGKPIILKFNCLSPDWSITKEEELEEWSKMMFKKYPKYLLIPSHLKDNKIVCCISESKRILSIKETVITEYSHGELK